jgi:hypothetical protein
MPKALNAIVGGWEVSGVYTIQSGLPVLFNADSFFSGKEFSLPRAERTLGRWFDTTQFVAFLTKNTNIPNFQRGPAFRTCRDTAINPRRATVSPTACIRTFSSFVRTYPYSWTDVRASRVNNVDGSIYKNSRAVQMSLKLYF